MNTDDKQYIDRLEQHARETIATLTRERDEARKELADLRDTFAAYPLTAALAREAKLREAWERIVTADQSEFVHEPSVHYATVVHRAVQETRKSLSSAALSDPHNLWLPIDSAPKDGSPILVNAGAEITTARWRPTPSQANGYWALCIYGDFASSDEVVPDPTHWQPLPPCKETRH